MKTITNKHIRAYFERKSDTIKVTIRRNGNVVVRTTKRRGDGGRSPWDMLAGHRDDIAFDIAQDIFDRVE
jgi:nanoRNase/pAp phosphatase (c-di-AMP/oligoRNAs hydrolase)